MFSSWVLVKIILWHFFDFRFERSLNVSFGVVNCSQLVYWLGKSFDYQIFFLVSKFSFYVMLGLCYKVGFGLSRFQEFCLTPWSCESGGWSLRRQLTSRANTSPKSTKRVDDYSGVLVDNPCYWLRINLWVSRGPGIKGAVHRFQDQIFRRLNPKNGCFENGLRDIENAIWRSVWRFWML